MSEAEAATPSWRKQPPAVATMEALEPRMMLSGSPWELSVAADDRFASEEAGDDGAIVITRTDTGTGDIDQPLTVNYSVGGTAEAGDYQALSGTVDILAGQTSVSIPVTPVDDTDAEFTETVSLTLTPDAGYDILASADTAEVMIADNDDGVAPAGDSFAVNTETNLEQKLWQETGNELAALPGGGFVSVWNSKGQDGSYWGVYGQIFDDAGVKVGSEFQVNTHTTLSQEHASVASDANGDFVVIWTSTGGQDGNLAGIFARRFDSQGTALSDEFQINSTTTGTQEMPEVSFLSDGRFVAVWTGKGAHDNIGVMARIFNADGTAATGEIAVNTHTSNQQQYATLGALPDGGFLVAWTSYLGQDGSVRGVFAQRFDSTGAASGDEFQVNTTTQGDQQYPSLAVAPDGNFVIVWQSDNGDNSGTSILAQRYDATGQATGSEFVVNSFTTNNQWYPSVAFGPHDRFMVAWARSGDVDVDGVHAREFAADGTPLRDQFLVYSELQSGTQTAPVVIGGDAGYVVAWSGPGNEDNLGVYARMFLATSTPPTTSGIADVNVDEDAADTVIDLFAAFADAESADELLTYEIISNTAPELFAAVVIDAGALTLALAANANGQGQITVRATDPRGLFVETTFNVVVAAVNDVPTTAGITDVAVDEDAPNTVIDLGAAFDDIENTDAELTYTIEGNTNASLFSTTGISGTDLTLAYAANANGSAVVTVRATDPEGLFVETTFNVVVAAVNDVPTTTGLTDIAVDEDAPATVIDLGAAFDDIENTDAELTYTVTTNTNPSLFSSTDISGTELTLAYAANAN
ncbi:MAG: LEPR-XLL domain-containing protein, partial [bacterium]|nr:LEPR-XLL domain-containing protein [bacterium]